MTVHIIWNIGHLRKDFCTDWTLRVVDLELQVPVLRYIKWFFLWFSRYLVNNSAYQNCSFLKNHYQPLLVMTKDKLLTAGKFKLHLHLPPEIWTPQPAVWHCRSSSVDVMESSDKQTGDTVSPKTSGFCNFSKTALPEYKKCLNLAWNFDILQSYCTFFKNKHHYLWICDDPFDCHPLGIRIIKLNTANV